MANLTSKVGNALAGAAKKIFAAGLRQDYRLELRRYPDQATGNELSMDPDLEAVQADTDPVLALEVVAPKVSVFSGFGFLAVQEAAGGVVEVGDHVVEFGRSDDVEAFLKTRLRELDDPRNDPYPEMEWVVFRLNGEDYRPVRWLVTDFKLKVYIRKIAG